jgi:hypothetical protein
MPFELDRYSMVRPMLYHLTASPNIERIRSQRQLVSVETLSNASDEEVDLRARREDTIPLNVDAYEVFIRDQEPLNEGNIEFEDGWEFGDLIECLNRLVFFWSGWERGPIRYGVNHFRHYRREEPSILRVPFDSLCERNRGRTPLFCKYNSGSPRCYQGRRSPRGPQTFLPAPAYPYNPGSVVEVAFLERVNLPSDTEVSSQFNSGWVPLYNDE